jgi:hypothetical protein
MRTTYLAGPEGHVAGTRDVPHADSRGAAGGRERRAAHGKIAAMRHENLLGIPATYLPENAEASTALQAADPATVAAAFPGYCAAWAALAGRALAAGDPVTAYAFARTGYHRGLDQLRRAGWRGQGPIPWEHEPNRGFLRSLYLLGAAAAAIGENDEADRCRDLLADSSQSAAAELAGA